MQFNLGGTLFPDGVPNILRIFCMGGTKYSRIYCMGVQKRGDAKYPMTPDHHSCIIQLLIGILNIHFAMKFMTNLSERIICHH